MRDVFWEYVGHLSTLSQNPDTQFFQKITKIIHFYAQLCTQNLKKIVCVDFEIFQKKKISILDDI